VGWPAAYLCIVLFVLSKYWQRINIFAGICNFSGIVRLKANLREPETTSASL